MMFLSLELVGDGSGISKLGRLESDTGFGSTCCCPMNSRSSAIKAMVTPMVTPIPMRPANDLLQRQFTTSKPPGQSVRRDQSLTGRLQGGNTENSVFAPLRPAEG